MAYSQKNKLKRIIDIQNVVIEETSKGVTQEWIYKNIIEPHYRISRACFYSYLNTNAKAMLRKMEAEEKSQISMF